jgi:hypothetical protein
MHVPLIMYWPEKVKEGKVNDDMVVFRDFFASFAEICNVELKSDGRSFFHYLSTKVMFLEKQHFPIITLGLIPIRRALHNLLELESINYIVIDRFST